MARRAEVNVDIRADASGVEKTFDRVGASARDMATDVGKSTKKMSDGLADGIDESERKFQGFGDTIEGTGDIMEGFRTGNIVQMARGFADLAGGITDFVVPAIRSMAARFGFMTSATVAQTGATTAAASAQVGLNAAMTANPIGAVVLALAALVGALVLAYKNSETFRNIVKGAFEALMKVVKPIIDGIGGALSWLANKLGFGGKSDVSDATEKMAEEMKAALERSQQAWKTWRDNISKTVDDLLNPLQRARDNSKVTFDEITKNLIDNEKFFEGWMNNLALLAERGFGRLAEHLFELGPTAEKAVGEAIRKSDKQLANMESLFAERGGMVGKGFVDGLARGIQQGDFDIGLTLTPTGDARGRGGIHRMHSGGVVTGPPGSDQLRVLQAGETVLPRGQSAGGGGVVVNVAGSVITERDLGRIVADALRQNKLIGVS